MTTREKAFQAIAKKGYFRPYGGGEHKATDKMVKDGLLRSVPDIIAGDPWGTYRLANEYYVRSQGYCGNFLFWWRIDGAGYCVDIREAEMMSFEEAKRIVDSDPQNFKMILCRDIEQNVECLCLGVDSQFIKL